MSAAGVIVIVIGLAIVIMLLLALVASMFRKVGPNQALIVFGFGGTKVVVGGGRVIWPMVQQSRELSLELMSFDVTPQNDFYSVQGVAVKVEAVAQIKVKSDQVSILTASEQFLNKPLPEREALIRLVVEGHLRGIIGQLRIEEIVKEPEMVAEKVRSQVADDMSKMGLEVISFTIKEVRDDNEYILNMGKPDIAAIKRQAEIASADADRDIAIRRAMADRDSRIAAAQAEQEKVVAETASQTKQAESFRDLEIKKAEYQSTVQIQKAQADKAYEIQTNIEQQRAIAEQVKIEQVRKHGEVAVQEAEIQRREKELIATVLKGAEIERQRIETLAEAERQRQVLQATGQAEATRLEGQAQAEVTKVRGLAEAEIILAKGQAEANAMGVKAEAFQSYNQAAILDKLLTGMPEMVRAMAEPLSKIDKITVVSTGDGNGQGAGVNRITSDMSTMLAQVPALFESLTGVDVGEMMQQVPKIGAGKNTVSANGSNGNAGSPVQPRTNGQKPVAVATPPVSTLDQKDPTEE
jgi:flotillin